MGTHLNCIDKYSYYKFSWKNKQNSDTFWLKKRALSSALIK